MFDVSWSGSYPTLCSGKWTILKDGEDVSGAIPKDLRVSYMNTQKEYVCLSLDKDNQIQKTPLIRGLDRSTWMNINVWIWNICSNDEEANELYDEIVKQDWFHNTCGGCYDGKRQCE